MSKRLHISGTFENDFVTALSSKFGRVVKSGRNYVEFLVSDDMDKEQVSTLIKSIDVEHGKLDAKLRQE